MYVPMTCIVIHFKEPNLRKTNLPIFPEKKFEHLLHPYFVICRRICSFTLYIHNYLKAGKPIKNKDWKCTRHLWQKFWYFEASRHWIVVFFWPLMLKNQAVHVHWLVWRPCASLKMRFSFKPISRGRERDWWTVLIL